uniref:Protein phosphatase 1 regulatory subunit 14 n=1 Tax=Mus spicilegus TaxID=10103 RepID=A0A8C6H6D4_MUSSI
PGHLGLYCDTLSQKEDSVPVTMVATAGQVQQQQRHHQQGKVTVKYDRKELHKRLVLEEWIVEQLGQLYGCEEEEMPDEERASKLQEALVVCYKPTEEFIRELRRAPSDKDEGVCFPALKIPHPICMHSGLPSCPCSVASPDFLGDPGRCWAKSWSPSFPETLSHLACLIPSKSVHGEPR